MTYLKIWRNNLHLSKMSVFHSSACHRYLCTDNDITRFISIRDSEPVLWYFNIDIILSNQINRMINDIICTSTCSEELKRDAKMWLMKPNLTFPFANTGSSNTIEIKYQYLFDLYVVVELLTSYLISFWYLPYINVIIHLNLFRAVFAWFPFFYLYFLYQGID